MNEKCQSPSKMISTFLFLTTVIFRHILRLVNTKRSKRKIYATIVN
jgi:hypothetical protein